jgi:hypothetical protein
MSELKVNTITNAAGGNTAQINGMTPTADSLQGFRNRVINGNMVIDQRNAGASASFSDFAYFLDRWNLAKNTGLAGTVQQSTVAPAGFKNSLFLTNNATGASPAASAANRLQTRIEGNNVDDLGFGTANAQAVTLSFLVRSSVTGTYSVGIANGAFDRSYVATYVVNAANTWEQKTITVPGDTSGTWLTNNGNGLSVSFDLGSGSNLNGTPNAWQSGNRIRTSGSVTWIATGSATFYITGVQLEAGSVATPFERRPFGTELALCQRYFYKTYNQSVVPGTATFSGVWSTTLTQSNQGSGYIESYAAPASKVTMRAAPTVTTYDTAGTSGKGSYYENAAFTNNRTITMQFTTETGFAWYSDNVTTKGGVGFQYTSSAEL